MKSPTPEREKGQVKNLKKLKSYLMPYRARIIGALVALTFSSGVVLGLGSALKYLIDDGISKHDVHLLDRSFMIFIALTFGLALATYARYYLVSWVGEKVVAD